jgi:hypothetical protein
MGDFFCYILLYINMDDLIDSKINLKDRVLIKPVFTNNSNEHTNLADYIVTFNDGQEWKIIPLDIIKMYPIIHDVYFPEGSEMTNAIPMTVYICPYTLFSVSYLAEYIPNNKIYNNSIVLEDTQNDKVIIPILNMIYNKTTGIPITKFIRRNEVRIMTLRNAISIYPDCQFIDISKIQPIQPLITANYLTNTFLYYPQIKFSDKYHSKTLVYIIEYKSKKTHTNKYSIIIPKAKTYDITKNGFGNYFNKMIDKIRDKGGMIYQALWFAWNATFPASKIIHI